jgi:flavodoxin I
MATGEPMNLGQQMPAQNRYIVAKVLVGSLVVTGCAVIFLAGGGQQMAVSEADMAMAMSPLQRAVGRAQFKTVAMGVGAMNGLPRSQRLGAAQDIATAARLAQGYGVHSGCRGNLQCARAVGLFFGTQGGNTETVAGEIASATGLEAKDIADASPGDLAGFDGLIVGAPTWHTGADEQRTGTAWDDVFDEIKGLSLSGKPVAVFGVGDSAGYGDNFCDAIEELHSTFEAAGAKMLGYVPDSNYEYYSESKSVKDGKFLGLPLDQDNEDDQTPDRVKAWVDQIKGEGMPLA